jgi:hypothetical protein
LGERFEIEAFEEVGGNDFEERVLGFLKLGLILVLLEDEE